MKARNAHKNLEPPRASRQIKFSTCGISLLVAEPESSPWESRLPRAEVLGFAARSFAKALGLSEWRLSSLILEFYAGFVV